jgi:hypothetical protein
MHVKVEEVISFLVLLTGEGSSEGPSQNMEPSMLLQDYALNAMRLSPEIWEETTTPTVRQTVRLCHLVSLYVTLEERIEGQGAAEKVAFKYRLPLTESLESELKDALPKIDAQVLLLCTYFYAE